MPRVAVKHFDYAVEDFTRKVKGKCAERGIRQAELAEVLNINQSALSKKMKSGSYSLLDVLKIIDYLHIEEEELGKILVR